MVTMKKIKRIRMARGSQLTARSHRYENSTVQHSKQLELTIHTDYSVFTELTIRAC